MLVTYVAVKDSPSTLLYVTSLIDHGLCIYFPLRLACHRTEDAAIDKACDSSFGSNPLAACSTSRAAIFLSSHPSTQCCSISFLFTCSCTSTQGSPPPPCPPCLLICPSTYTQGCVSSPCVACLSHTSSESETWLQHGVLQEVRHWRLFC